MESEEPVLKKIVVLGAGYGGVDATKQLCKRFKRDKDVEITLIDKNPFHTLMTELHEVAGGRCEPESVQVSLAKIFGGKKVNLVLDRIEDIHFDTQVLTGKAGTYHYDYLVLGPGAEPEYFGITGAADHAFSLWSYDDAVKLRRHIENQYLKASREPRKEERKKILTFAVAGAGFTGIEMLGELLEDKKVQCERYGVDESEVSILLIEAMAEILPNLPKKPREKALTFLKKKGADVRLNTPIVEVKPDSVVVKGGAEIACETLIWTCGVKGCEFAGNLNFSNGAHSSKPAESEEDHNLRFNIKKKCRIQSNQYMQSLDYPNVYLVGDVIWYKDHNHTLPQVVETAMFTAHVSAYNIWAEIHGKEKKKFRSNYHGFLVSIGSKFAVAHIMGISMSGFLAAFMKHMVNFYHLFTVAGVNLCWEYAQHHFLAVKNKRSMIGGHASAKTPSYWLLPLRLALGAMWFAEVLHKVFKGWLETGTASKSYWMFSPGVVQAGAVPVTGATPEKADAVTAATGAGIDLLAEMAKPVFHKDFILTKGMNWFMDTFVSQIPFTVLQYSVLGVELALALAFLGGTFTFAAGIVSIVLCLNFTLAGFFTWNQLWMIFASVAMLGGAGKVLGLDYWLMPWLQKGWNKTKLAKKTYLYVGEPGRKSK